MFNTKKLKIIVSIVLISVIFLSCYITTPVEAAQETISIDMRNADIRDVLSAFALNTGKNIIFIGAPAFIDVNIQDVPHRAALEYVLGIVGYDYIEDNNTIIVGLRETLSKEFYSSISLSKFALKYITSEIISSQIDTLGIPVKKITMESNDKVIWIQGLPQELSKINELINMLDRPENAANQVEGSTVILTPITTKHIKAEQANDLINRMGISSGLVLELNPMVLWVFADNATITQLQSIIKKIDIPENSLRDSFSITPIKLKYLSSNEIIPIIGQMDIDITILTIDKSLKTIWLAGSNEAISLANEVIAVFDIKDHTSDGIFFVYKTVGITAKELKSRLEEIDLPNVKVNYLSYPQFSKSIIIYCPSDYKLYVMNHIKNLDVMTEKIKVPIDYSNVAGGASYLRNRLNLIVELSGIPSTSFAISNNVARDESYYYIMYAEETQENINLIKEYIKFIDSPLSEGQGG